MSVTFINYYILLNDNTSPAYSCHTFNAAECWCNGYRSVKKDDKLTIVRVDDYSILIVKTYECEC